MFFAVLVAVAAGVAASFYTDYLRFADAPLAPLAEGVSINVPLGTSLPGTVRLLEDAGVRTESPLYWRALAWQMHAAGRLHAGEYALPPGITPRELLRRMAAGEVVQHRFTIVEGWTFAQLRAALAQDAELGHELGAMSDADLMRRLGAAGALPEGWFLPETYNFVKGMSDLDILRRAHEAMQKALDKGWAERAPDLPLESPYQALILASIVEKETGRPEERPRIAGLFLHRLKLGMKLQTDPSVIYGLGAAYDGNLHKRDLEADTPFNTYTRAGLPPTPIALPGAAAIAAVLHPAATDALYFVARGDGTHEFSATLEAHNRAVDKYQLHKQ
ncbi:MAG TPA: endolytic transglycosylase MltG [Rudaea sp.]|nr:endolytic transglycosylase MltG [Rudaea sp.]